MSRLGALCRRLRGDPIGSTAVEFALLAPVIIGALFGVVQIGQGYQKHSAMRQLSADTARYILVNSSVDNASVGALYTTRAAESPYLLKGATVTVTNAATQRFAGAKEKTIAVSTPVSNVFASMGFTSSTMTYEQPVFVCSSC